MRRPTPPLEARGNILRAWSQVGTPSEVCRRLGGRYGRATVNNVRDWATIHSFLQQSPPDGLHLSRNGHLWLAELDAGLDPDARRRTEYSPPSVPTPPARRGPTGLRRHSIPWRVLRHLNRHGAECITALTRQLRLSRRQVRNACGALRENHYVLATGRRMTIIEDESLKQDVVMLYRCTAAGRAALEAAK